MGMKKSNISFFLFFTFFTILLIQTSHSDLNCGIFTTGSCPANNVDLLYMKNDTGGYNNSHAQLPTVATYSNVLCCNSTTQTLGNASTGVPFLNLSATTNAHVQAPTYTGATKYTHATNISSDITPPTCGLSDDSCSSGYTCLVSIAGDDSNTTNAHVGDCNQYKKKVCCKVDSGYLEVNLVTPAATQNIVQNRTFTVNATVYCRQAGCGNVQGTVQYNGSSTNPDTPVNVTTGDKPFFINETSAVAVKNCPTNPLSRNEYCNITWTVNASGNINSAYKLGVLFNSTISGVSNNHTTNSTTTIVGCVADLTLQWSSINFGALNPSSTQNAASGNANKQYNITINYGSCTPDLWIRGEGLTNTTLGYTIGVGNLTWSNSTNNYANSYNMTTYYRLVDEDVPEETNDTTYYWLNVPAVAAGGPYKGNITIMTNRTG